MKLGAQITLFAGATLIAINLITFLFGSELTFSRYGTEAGIFSDFLLLGGAIFLEVLVAGLVFTFIALQYYKSRTDYNG